MCPPAVICPSATDNNNMKSEIEKSGNDKAFLAVKFTTIFVLVVFAILTCVGIARSYRPLPAPDDWHGLDFFINVSEGNWQAWFAQFLEHRPVLPRVFYWVDFK